MFILKPYFEADAGANPNPGGGAPPTNGGQGGDGGSGAAGGGAGGGDNSATEQQEMQTLLSVATPDATQKARLAELQSKYETQYVDDKGNPLTPEQITTLKANQAKLDAILAKEEKDRTPEEIKFIEENTEADVEDKNVYQQIDEANGIDYQIDYKGVDPLSADGIQLREGIIAETARLQFENTIKTKLPRAYQFMQHLAAGGKEDDFFKPNNQDFKSITLTKDDVAGQEKVLRTALALKGNSPDLIELAVTSWKDTGKLLDVAKSELEALQKDQAAREAQTAAAAQRAAQLENQTLSTLADKLEEAVEKGFDSIVIPVADRQKFYKFMADRVQYNNGKVYMSKEVNLNELNKELKVAYFEFKGGDLKGLADRAAKSQQALRLKGGLKQVIKPRVNGGGGSVKQKPLGSY